jgi:hypothetical protein
VGCQCLPVVPAHLRFDGSCQAGRWQQVVGVCMQWVLLRQAVWRHNLQGPFCCLWWGRWQRRLCSCQPQAAPAPVCLQVCLQLLFSVPPAHWAVPGHKAEPHVQVTGCLCCLVVSCRRWLPGVILWVDTASRGRGHCTCCSQRGPPVNRVTVVCTNIHLLTMTQVAALVHLTSLCVVCVADTWWLVGGAGGWGAGGHVCALT